MHGCYFLAAAATVAKARQTPHQMRLALCIWRARQLQAPLLRGVWHLLPLCCLLCLVYLQSGTAVNDPPETPKTYLGVMLR